MKPEPGTWTTLQTFPLDSLAAWLRARGATVDDAIGEVEGFARFVTVRDPDGNPVQLIEYAR